MRGPSPADPFRKRCGRVPHIAVAGISSRRGRSPCALPAQRRRRQARSQRPRQSARSARLSAHAQRPVRIQKEDRLRSLRNASKASLVAASVPRLVDREVERSTAASEIPRPQAGSYAGEYTEPSYWLASSVPGLSYCKNSRTYTVARTMCNVANGMASLTKRAKDIARSFL